MLTDEQRQIQRMVRRVARESVAARAGEIDRSSDYPEDMFTLLRELGLFALPFPIEYGGTGSSLSACLAIEELGRACYNTAYLLAVQDALRRHTGGRHRSTKAGLAAGTVIRKRARVDLGHRGSGGARTSARSALAPDVSRAAM